MNIPPFRALLKGLAIAAIISLLLPLALPRLGGVAPELGQISAYNLLFPGRLRLPFGETPSQAYNLSLYDIPAMFAAHEISQPKAGNEFRVLVLGDSSVWGTLLRPGETLPTQLNAQNLAFCDKTAHFYNLGYPTISLTKDLLLLDYAARFQPDAILWLITLEALPLDKQLASPLAANNADRLADLIARYDLPLDPRDPALVHPTYWNRTLPGQRRALADLIRLQLYGVPWAATGIDQFYPASYHPPQTDFEEQDDKFHDLRPPLAESQLAYSILRAGIENSPVQVWLVNEPMLVSAGKNSHIRYNFFYPRWAYDAYRLQLADHASRAGWNYLDLWDLLPPEEFTNSAIHLTPAGESLLAKALAERIQFDCYPVK